MSAASKCDLCGSFFKPESRCVSLEVSVNADGELWDTWSDVDFCGPCSAKVLALIEPAIEDVSPE